MSLFDEASLVVTPNGFKAGKLYSIKPTDGSGDLNVVRATNATRVNADGFIETVDANVPRLDYTNGDCPSILVEPQGTNLLLRSEEFDNVAWGNIRCSVLPNQTNAPNNESVADYIQQQTASFEGGFVFQSFTGITIGQSYVFSVFAKKNGKNFIALRPNLAGSDSTWFDLNNGTIGVTGASHTPKIEAFNDGWYRCSVKFNAVNSSGTNNIYIYDNNGQFSVADSGGVFVYGAQLEQGSNATSYIPTVASAVTRNADVISKTGISDLIGQTEGTLFVDLKALSDSQNRRAITLNDGTSQNNIIVRYSTVSNQIDYLVYSGNVLQVNMSKIVSDITNKNKVMVTYKNNQCKLFVNGELVNTDTSATMPTSLTKLSFDNGGNTNYFEGKLNNLALWKTALTDQECINLTTL